MKNNKNDNNFCRRTSINTFQGKNRFFFFFFAQFFNFCKILAPENMRLAGRVFEDYFPHILGQCIE